ncbi:helix-turn-helix domain-containing protein [Ruegeria sp.]|uniref:helix-turn-helix domain-containing protein n=1 Tax=Ruegeria sp. TaxID=1879320 RepID=UPI003C7E8263
MDSSPKQFYLRFRLIGAYFLLTQTGMSILDINLASGFTSHRHFLLCFREEFGKTPTRMCKSLVR